MFYLRCRGSIAISPSVLRKYGARWEQRRECGSILSVCTKPLPKFFRNMIDGGMFELLEDVEAMKLLGMDVSLAADHDVMATGHDRSSGSERSDGADGSQTTTVTCPHCGGRLTATPGAAPAEDGVGGPVLRREPAGATGRRAASLRPQAESRAKLSIFREGSDTDASSDTLSAIDTESSGLFEIETSHSESGVDRR